MDAILTITKLDGTEFKKIIRDNRKRSFSLTPTVPDFNLQDYKAAGYKKIVIEIQ